MPYVDQEHNNVKTFLKQNTDQQNLVLQNPLVWPVTRRVEALFYAPCSHIMKINRKIAKAYTVDFYP